MAHAKIKSIKDQNPFISFLLMSESGWGKTVFGGTARKGLILSSDPEGTDAAAVQGTTCEQWEVRSYADIDESYRYLRDGGHRNHDWVIIDTAYETQKIFQRDWLDKNAGNAGKRHPEVLGMDGYQITQNQLLAYVKQMNDLPMHKLWTTKIQQWEDEEGEVYYLADLHGQKGDISRQVAGYMKLAGYGVWANPDDLEDETRRIVFSGRGAYRGKDRFDAMGHHRDNMTLPKIEAIVKKRIAETTGAPTKKPGSATRVAAKKPTAIRRRAATPTK